MKRSLKYLSGLSLIPAVLLLSGCSDGTGIPFAERMATAGMNTLMGMGVVFTVLILICFIIWLFGFIGKSQERKQQRIREKERERIAEEIRNEAPPSEEPEETEDTELVAVIAAAIAAAEGTSPDGVIVRSIRRVGSANTWKRG